MTAPDDVECRLATDPAELAAAAELVYTSIPGLDRAGVRQRFSPEHAKQPTTVIAVAVVGTQVVGTLMSGPDTQLTSALPTDEVGLYSLLHYVAVSRRWHRQGIGKQLVGLARAQLQMAGVRRWIGGAENSEAGAFFASSGFTVLPPDTSMPLPGHGRQLCSRRPGYRWFHQDW